jgi:hypothetical protein
MAGTDPKRAADDLAEADERLRRGAELVLPRWWTPALLLFLVLQTGVSWDMPASRWRGVLMVAAGSAMLACVALAATRARARPLPIKVGWRTGLMIAAVAITSYAVMMGLGLALRLLAVPLPFTLSAVLMAVPLALLGGRLRHWNGTYLQQVRRNQW